MWMIGTKCTILEGILLWCDGKLKELPWSFKHEEPIPLPTNLHNKAKF